MDDYMTLELVDNDSDSGSDTCSEGAVIPSLSEEPTEWNKDMELNDKEEQQAPINADNIEQIRDDASALTRIESLYDHLSEQISTMETLFAKRIMHTDYEDKVIDRMHDELQRYKEDLYSQLVRPILLDIIEVRDSIMKNAATYLARAEGEQSIPNNVFSAYAFDLQDILEKNNVEIYRSNSGDLFVPLKQRVVKKEITEDESLHGKIAESLSDGYNFGGRVISSEKVSIYLYQKAEINESEDK